RPRARAPGRPLPHRRREGRPLGVPREAVRELQWLLTGTRARARSPMSVRFGFALAVLACAACDGSPPRACALHSYCLQQTAERAREVDEALASLAGVLTETSGP